MNWIPLIILYAAVYGYIAAVSIVNSKSSMNTRERRRWLTDELRKREDEMRTYDALADGAVDLKEYEICGEWEIKLQEARIEADIIEQLIKDL